jgi:hypothetical protein
LSAVYHRALSCVNGLFSRSAAEAQRIAVGIADGAGAFELDRDVADALAAGEGDDLMFYGLRTGFCATRQVKAFAEADLR